MPSRLRTKLPEENIQSAAQLGAWKIRLDQTQYEDRVAVLLPRRGRVARPCMKPRILIVDDEISILHTLADAFELSGYEAEVAASAREAVSKIAINRYDVVLTDMRMERVDSGYEVLEAAKRSHSQPSVAIMTAYVESLGDWHSKGAQCVVEKPMGVRALVTRIDEVLSRSGKVA